MWSIGEVYSQCINGSALTIIGDGEQTRDYTYIDDAVDATILSAVHPRALGEVFNVGTSVETSVNELAELVKHIKPNIEITSVAERDIDNIRRRSVDIEKIHRLLGWAPQWNVKKGIQHTFEWYKGFLNN
mgnify:CR=1 FL=1